MGKPLLDLVRARTLGQIWMVMGHGLVWLARMVGRLVGLVDSLWYGAGSYYDLA